MAGGGVGIGVDEAAELGVVVAGLEVIEPGIDVIIIRSVAQGVIRAQGACQGAGGAEHLAVGTVGIANYRSAGGIYNVQNIALEVRNVIVQGAVILNRIGRTHGIVEEIQSVAAPGLPHQLAAGIIVFMLGGAYLLTQPQAFGIIGVGNALATAGSGHQSPALCPAKCPGGSVVVTSGITAARLVGNSVAVHGSEQVPPRAVAIGIAVAGSSVGGCQNIARGIIGVGICLTAADLLQKLVLGIVGIGVGGAALGVGGDIAQNIVGIAVGDIRGKIVGQSCHLCSGVRSGGIPIGIGLAVNAACDAGQPLQHIIVIGARAANRGGMGGQQAGGQAVGIALGIVGAAHLPGLGGQLVVGIVGLPGGEDIARAVFHRACHQAALRIVAILIGKPRLTILHGVQLPVAGIAVGQDTAVGIGGGLHPPQIVVGEGYVVAVAIALAGQQAVFGTMSGRARGRLKSLPYNSARRLE